MNVALYLRYSSGSQTEQSIEGQERVCTDYCARENHKIISIYIDRATSASKDTDKRHEFLRMIEDSGKGRFDAVVVYKLDRFARNRYDFAIYKSKLKKNNVEILSATEPISRDPEGILLESMLEGMAEYYSAELSQKVSRGIYQSALKGNFFGGTCPLGYKIENKKYVIDPARAPYVKEIFSRYASGETMKQIIDYMNASGIRTAIGNEWSRNSLRKMLVNEKYIGTYRYKDICLEDAIPAIIDKETFATVAERMRENKSNPARGKASVLYLLSNKLICGHCGAKMTGETGTNSKGMKIPLLHLRSP